MKTILRSLPLLLPAWAAAAPVQIARESFEGSGGSIGYTSNFINTGSGFTPVCDAVPNDGSRIKGNRIISGANGARMFAGARINGSTGVSGNFGPTPIEVTTNAVNIAGKINTSVKVLLSAPGDHNGTSSVLNVYDAGDPSVNLERIVISASVDGGAWLRLGQYSPNGGSGTVNSVLAWDGNGDGTGNETPPSGVPATLDDTFREAEFAIPTGNNVQVKVTFFTNGSFEYILFDDIRIFGEDAATNPPAIAGVPATPLEYAEGSGPVGLAPALTLADSDSATLSSASVSISQNFVSGEDVLAATPSGGIGAGQIAFAGGTLTISGPASPADFQAVLRSVTYANANVVNPSTATRHVTFSATDGTNSSNSPVREINVTDIVPVQSLPFTETFETDGRGTRYGVLGGFSSGSNLFARIDPDPDVPGTDGAHVFAAEHTQTDAAPLEAVTVHVNAEDYGNLKLDLLAAAQGGAVFEQTDDFLLIQTSVDGGPWTTTGAFRSTGAVNSTLAVDTDLNGQGDGTALTGSFQDFSFDLPDATTLGVRLVASTDGTGERILFDNLRITGEQASFAIADASAAENSGSVSLTVTRSGLTEGSATLDYGISGGTATAGTDFNAAGGTVNFADGETTASIVVPVTGDSTVELDETFTVTISNPSTGSITTAEATGTITNDDSATLSLAGGTVAEGDSGNASLPFTLTLSNPVDTAVTVDRETLTSGSATAGSDFAALSAAQISIPAGETTASFNVTVNGDNDVESDETVDASVSNLAAGGRSVTLGTAAASGTITDDDPLLVAGDGSLGVKIGTSGKLKIAGLLALTSPVEGREVSLVSVQETSTAGGTVTIVDGWIHYQPPAGYSGADSFTFTITDGVQTVTGTVNIASAGEIGTTLNIAGIVTQGDDKVVVCLGIPGRRYQLQVSDDLSSWAPSGASQICPASGVMAFTDEGPLPPTRFYRVIEFLPPP